jgi:hypothetical protein
MPPDPSTIRDFKPFGETLGKFSAQRSYAGLPRSVGPWNEPGGYYGGNPFTPPPAPNANPASPGVWSPWDEEAPPATNLGNAGGLGGMGGGSGGGGSAPGPGAIGQIPPDLPGTIFDQMKNVPPINSQYGELEDQPTTPGKTKQSYTPPPGPVQGPMRDPVTGELINPFENIAGPVMGAMSRALRTP